MTDTTELNVGIDPNAEMYVVKRGGIASGVTTYSWDFVKDRTERMALNLVIEDYVAPATGTREAWDAMCVFEQALKRQYEQTGEKAICDLSMDLIGLEGHRVEVIDDVHSEPRRFIVGRSTGWIPVHLEIKTTRSMGGEPARREYLHVTDLGMTSR